MLGAVRDLGGRWRVAPADDDARRSFTDPQAADGAWECVSVPGRWQEAPPFAEAHGPLLFRRAFGAVPPPAGRRAWLTFEGVFYQADVFLDGGYIGDTEGYFFPHSFEVTDALQNREDHVLAVEVACPAVHDSRRQRNLTGVFQDPDVMGPSFNPGGIWRPVLLYETGRARLHAVRVRCLEANAERAVLAFTAVVDVREPMEVCLRSSVEPGPSHDEVATVAEGHNVVEWRITVDEPRLWWPRALGDADLVDVVVELLAEGEVSDRWERRTGLREIRLRRWIAHVNGERLFLKGTSVLPNAAALSDGAAEQVRGDVERAAKMGFDLVRVFGHVSRPELYDAADELGLLVWQDLPLQWTFARGVRGQAVRQAVAAVDELSHHPSVAVWCAHTKPFRRPEEGDDPPRTATGPATSPGLALPTWNRTVLDHSIARALERADRSRPVVSHSGVPTTDTHLSFSHRGGHRDIARLAAAWPRMVRFVGALTAPVTTAEVDEIGSGEASPLARQVLQLRRLKYRPTGGFCLYPPTRPGSDKALSLDQQTRTERDEHALRQVCAPVVVIGDPLPAAVTPGETLRVDVHAVSDLRTALAGVEVEARLHWGGSDYLRSWTGDLPADSVVRVGEIATQVPQDASGDRVALTLHLTAPGGTSALYHDESPIRRA